MTYACSLYPSQKMLLLAQLLGNTTIVLVCLSVCPSVMSCCNANLNRPCICSTMLLSKATLCLCPRRQRGGDRFPLWLALAASCFTIIPAHPFVNSGFGHRLFPARILANADSTWKRFLSHVYLTDIRIGCLFQSISRDSSPTEAVCSPSRLSVLARGQCC